MKLVSVVLTMQIVLFLMVTAKKIYFSNYCEQLGGIVIMTSCYWFAPRGTRGDNIGECQNTDDRARIAWVTTLNQVDQLQVSLPLMSSKYVYIGWWRNVTKKVKHLQGYYLVDNKLTGDIRLPDQTKGSEFRYDLWKSVQLSEYTGNIGENCAYIKERKVADNFCNDVEGNDIRVLCEIVDSTRFIEFQHWPACSSLNTTSEAVFSMGIFNERISCTMEARNIGPVLTALSYDMATGECFGSISNQEKLMDHVCDTSTSFEQISDVFIPLF